MGLGATKPVFGISNKARLKLVSLASLDMKLSNEGKTNVLIRLRGSKDFHQVRGPLTVIFCRLITLADSSVSDLA